MPVNGKMAKKPVRSRVLLLKHKETGHVRIVVQDIYSYEVRINSEGTWQNRTQRKHQNPSSTQHPAPMLAPAPGT